MKDAKSATDVPVYQPTSYHAQEARLFHSRLPARCATRCQRRQRDLVDVRSPQEFTGEILAPPGLPETAQRGGHIPGARSIPWGKAANEDGTFKSFEELKSYLRCRRNRRQQTSYRLLPDWGTIQLFLVCFEISARL